MHGHQKFPKSLRLQHGYEFRRVYEQGSRQTGKLVVLHTWRPPETSLERGTAVGMVSSRRIGGAVIRNRARRLMREAFRLNQQKLKPNTQLVLVARSAISGATLAEVETELLQLMRAADVLTTES